MITSTKNAPHFVWGNHCDGWWLKQGGKFTVISETMPAGTSETKHFHAETEQFFYVLEGVLSIELDDVMVELKPHEGIVVAANVVHQVVNCSDNVVQFLVISCPDSHRDRVEVE